MSGPDDRDGRDRRDGPPTTSRISGFHRNGIDERLDRLARASGVERAEIEATLGPAGLDRATADKLIENVVGLFELPFAVGLNLRVNGRDRIVPMAVEEPSIVAAFSRVARLVRRAGGFEASCDDAIVAAQIHLTDVPDADAAIGRIEADGDRLMGLADAEVPRLVARGGGARRVSARRHSHDESGQAFLTVHVHVDVRDAMGANLANTIAESLAEPLEELTGGRAVMCILSNLADERVARARCAIPWDALAFGGCDGPDAARRIEEGWRLADSDPYRAVTHNKGVMNGIDAAGTALGQDVRALEAGAHAFAARSGQYRPLSRFVRDHDAETLVAEIAVPMAVTTVGPLRRTHPGVGLALRLLGVERARELGGILACVGLAQSLGAVQALVTEGIQRGHMRLHARKKETD